MNVHIRQHLIELLQTQMYRQIVNNEAQFQKPSVNLKKTPKAIISIIKTNI